MQTITVPVAITAEDRARLRAEERTRNARLERDRTREKNLRAGKGDPSPGDELHVATKRGIPARARAGLMFGEQPAKVLVIDASDEDVAAKQRAGAYVVNRWGAHQILADANDAHTGLVIYSGALPAVAQRALEDMGFSPEELEAAAAKVRARAPRDAEQRMGGAGKPDEGAKPTATEKPPKPATEKPPKPATEKPPKPAAKPAE